MGIAMKHTEFMEELYRTNREQIRNHVLFAACTALFLTYSGFGSMVNAAAAQLSTGQAELLGGTGFQYVSILCSSIGIAIDSATIFAIIASLSIFQYLCGTGGTWELENPIGPIEDLLAIDLGLMETVWIAVVMLLLFAIPKILRMSGTSRVLGVTIQELENNVGGILVAVLVIYTWFDTLSQGSTVQVAAQTTTQNTVATVQTVGTIASFLFLFGLLIMSRIVFFVVSTAYYYMDIVLIPTSVIPFASAIIEIFKSISVITLFYLAYAFPQIFMSIACVLFLICLIIFQKAYIAVRYFKDIYVKPLVAKVWKYSEPVVLVSPKVPSKIKKRYESQSLDLAIPVYAVKKYRGMEKVKKYQGWWYISCQGENFLYKTKFYWRKIKTIDLNAISGTHYINKGMTNIEFFNLSGDLQVKHRFQRVKKQFHFVMRKDYAGYYDSIRSMLCCEDFRETKEGQLEAQKFEKQQQKEFMRQQKEAQNNTNEAKL